MLVDSGSALAGACRMAAAIAIDPGEGLNIHLGTSFFGYRPAPGAAMSVSERTPISFGDERRAI